MKHSFSDAGDLRKYFAAIPNIVFMLGLNPYELALYAHFKQAAGDNGGVCWKSRATIAKESGMSAGMVSKARVALEKPRSELNEQPLIIATEQINPKGGKSTWHIAITDIWAINMGRFTPSPHDVANNSTSLSVSTTSPHVRDNVTTRDQRKTQEEKPKKKSAHALLMGYHANHLRGEIPDPAAQGAAAKWLLERYSTEAIQECYQRLSGETWRSGVTLLTVKKMISQVPKVAAPGHSTIRTYEWMGRLYGLDEVISDDGQRYTVMGPDGTPTKRWHTLEAFAADKGITLEQAKHGMGT